MPYKHTRAHVQTLGTYIPARNTRWQPPSMFGCSHEGDATHILAGGWWEELTRAQVWLGVC